MRIHADIHRERQWIVRQIAVRVSIQMPCATNMVWSIFAPARTLALPIDLTSSCASKYTLCSAEVALCLQYHLYAGLL